MLLKLTNELGNGLFTSEKEWGVLLAEIQQAPVGADGGERLTDRFLRVRPRWLTVNGSEQRVEQDRIVDTRAQIDPGVLN